MKLHQLLEGKKISPASVEEMIEFMEKSPGVFDDVEEGGDEGQVTFVALTSMKPNCAVKLKDRGWDFIVQGFDSDIFIEGGCDGARVKEIAKSLTKKWFKENDPDFED